MDLSRVWIETFSEVLWSDFIETFEHLRLFPFRAVFQLRLYIAFLLFFNLLSLLLSLHFNYEADL